MSDTFGKEVLLAVACRQPDVLLDIQMPIMDGIETLREMQRTATLVPTLVLTTFGKRNGKACFGREFLADACGGAYASRQLQ